MLILSHREELVWQLKKYFDCSYGVEKADIHSNGEEVVSASVQSLVRRLDSFSPDDFDIIITDEAHHAVAPTYKKIYEYFNPRLHIGFTATPNRADNVKLGEIYSSIIFERNLKWGIKNNYLSNIRCLKIDIGYDISEVSSQNGDLNVGELSSAMDIQKQNKAIAEAYEKYAVGQTLIFATSVNHARNIAMEIPGSRVVTGETENRDEIIADFTARKIPCIVNCMVFTEGTDMPLIETVIIARPTRNASLYAQMVGRGLRLHEGKKELLLMDCVGVTGKIKLCTAPSLFGISEVPASIPQEEIEGQLITDIEDRIKYEMNKPQDWQINAHLVDIFEEENSYDTHDVNYVMLPDGDMVSSYDRNCCIRVESEDMTGNSRAVLYENKLPVKTTVRMYMQNVLDFVYNFLVTNFPNNHKLWDMKSVRKWGGQPASDAQKRLIYRNRKKLSDLDIDYDMNNPCGKQSVEYNDNRIALYVAQKGRCAVTKVKLAANEIDCHHKTPIEYGGGDEYKNLIIVSDKVHILIHSSNHRTLKKYLALVNPDEKQLAKINKLRKLAHMPEISINGELLTV